MATKTTQNELTEDGMRYKKKIGTGSDRFVGAEKKMSCFKCARFVERNQLTTKRILGRNTLVCAQGCTT